MLGVAIVCVMYWRSEPCKPHSVGNRAILHCNRCLAGQAKGLEGILEEGPPSVIALFCLLHRATECSGVGVCTEIQEGPISCHSLLKLETFHLQLHIFCLFQAVLVVGHESLRYLVHLTGYFLCRSSSNNFSAVSALFLLCAFVLHVCCVVVCT